MSPEGAVRQDLQLSSDNRQLEDRSNCSADLEGGWYGALEFRTLAETVVALIGVLSTSGHCVYANSAAQRYAGTSGSQLLGRGALRFVAREDRRRLLYTWRSVQVEVARFGIECQLRSHSGEFRWHQLRGAPVLDANGRPLRWVVSCSDIHALRIALAAAQDASEMLKVVGASTDALVFAKDGQGRMAYANDATLKVLEAAADEVIGQHPVPHSSKPWELAEISLNDARVIAEGRMIVSEESWTGRDGRSRIYRSTKGPWARADGSTGVIGFTVDITAEKRLAESAEDDQSMFTKVFENVPAVLWLTDERGRVILRNNVWTSYTGLPFVDNDFAFKDLIDPRDLEAFLSRWDAAVDDGDLLECDVRLLDALHAKPLLHRITLIPIRSSQGLITGWVGSAMRL